MEEGKPLYIVIRHGERADNVPDPKVTYDIDFDPCLTTLGLKQAFDTGVFLQKEFNLKSRTVYIYCSPLLRTMQSAAQCLRGIGLDSTMKINIRNYLVEELYASGYPVDPIKNCLFRKKDHDWLKANILKGIDYTEDTIEIRFPETDKEITNRCWKGFDYFINLHGNEKNVAVLLVSHGRMLDEFSEYFFKSYTCNYMYSSVSAVEIEGKGQYKMLLKDYHGHVCRK